jgi:hypothetical protein
MKEVLTKRFWQDVKKTFEEARDGTPENASDPAIAAKTQPDGVPSAESTTATEEIEHGRTQP